jgi:hypothetical protein
VGRLIQEELVSALHVASKCRPSCVGGQNDTHYVTMLAVVTDTN